MQVQMLVQVALKAVHTSTDGTWHITGTKRYITSGDADFYDKT
jgi:alkylation response protein AidB-like acyl-CoA dehydrogenase